MQAPNSHHGSLRLGGVYETHFAAVMLHTIMSPTFLPVVDTSNKFDKFNNELRVVMFVLYAAAHPVSPSVVSTLRFDGDNVVGITALLTLLLWSS